MFKKIDLGGFFSVKVVFGSKVYRRCFALSRKKMASNSGDNVEDKLADDATRVVGNEGEFHHSRDEHPLGDLS